MGFFDFLGKKKPEETAQSKTKPDASSRPRDFARFARLAGDKMAQNYDRQEAIEALSKMKSSGAAEGLLRRFSFTMEPSITDQEEKEAAAEGIVAAGSAALEPIRAYCVKAESLTWPLRILRRIVPQEEIVDELLGILDQFDTEYMRNPEPKIQLLSVLEEYRSDDVRIASESFLGDVSDPVRFQAVGTVFAMNDQKSVPSLIAALEQEESLRIRNRIASGLAERAWPIPEELRETCARALPSGSYLDGSIVRSGR